MSKSDKDSAIFMEDPASEVERKLMSAYCPKAEEASVAAVAAEVRPKIRNEGRPREGESEGCGGRGEP
eukprot:scaffold33399_cov51-Isochrysis_galbana.AAC.1